MEPSQDRRLRGLDWVCFAAVLVCSGMVSWHFHDRSWYPPDDCSYAHVAERVLGGESLNGDVQDVHFGLIHFLHAAAFSIFGVDLVSLKYPLAAMNLVQASLMFWLLRGINAVTAAVGAIALSILSFPQFVNPTANWYCLCGMIILIGVCTWWPSHIRGRTIVLGLIFGLLFGFRQLSGVIAAIATVTYLLAETVPAAKDATAIRGPTLARVACGLMFAGLLAYLVKKVDPIGVLLFGTAPLGLIVWTGIRTRRSNREVVALTGRLLMGFIVALAPLFVYHLSNGTLTSWINDTVVRAEGLTDVEFFDSASYLFLCLLGLREITVATSGSAVINGIFWYILPLLAPLLGLLVLIRLVRTPKSGSRIAPLAFIATIYSVVSMHYQIPIYLFYTVGLTIGGLLLIAAESSRASLYFMTATAAALAMVGLAFHAGQPTTRTLSEIVQGKRVGLVWAAGLPRCSLWIAESERNRYEALLSVIEQHTDAGDPILALPVNPELYFLSGRRNPCRFYNVVLELQSPADLERTLQRLQAELPALIFFRPEDKYASPLCHELVNQLQSSYRPLRSVEGFEIYALNSMGN